MALTLLSANNASTVLAAGISSSATTLTVNTGTGGLFPSPVSGTSFFKLTLVDAATGTLTEIVHVTARSGDTMTIVRGQEGTVSRIWSANDIAANMMTAGTLSYVFDSLQPLDETLTSIASLATGANKLPYFTGNDTAGQTDFTTTGRDIVGLTSISGVLSYLGAAPIASPALTGIPTTPTAAAGTNTTQIASMAALQTAINDTHTFAASGYQRLPSGLMIQWGTGLVNTPGVSQLYTLPQAFTSAFYQILATHDDGLSTTNNVAAFAANPATSSLTQFNAVGYHLNASATACGFRYIAIGR